MKRTRRAPDERKAAILAACLKLAEQRIDYRFMTRSEIARAAGCSNNLVTHYFSSMAKLRAAVMAEAIRERNLFIIGIGILARNSKALKVPDDVRREAIAAIL